MSVYYNTGKARNPQLKELIDEIIDITSGHNHDGTNSKSVTVGTVADSAVTNAKLATDVKVGSVAALTTTANTNVVAAINELDGEHGALSGLTTTSKTNFVGAINEVDADVGNVATLTTTAKTVVGAINELDADNASFATKTGSETLTNKTLTSPTLNTARIGDGDTGVTFTSADQTNAAPTVTIPDIGDAADTFCMVDTAQTLTNKTLTTPKIVTTGAICDAGGDEYIKFVEATTPITYVQITSGDTTVAPKVQGAGETNIDLHLLGSGTGNVRISDGTDPLKCLDFELSGATSDKKMTITSSHSDNRTITLPNATDTLVGKATSDTLTNKTVTNLKIDDSDAGCTITSADQTNAAATVTIPDIGDAADSFVMNDTSATLTNKTLTAPAINSPDFVFGSSAVNFAGGHADYTLSAAEIKSTFLVVTNADAGANIIAPNTANKVYCVINGSGQAITILVSGQTGITIANGKSAFVRGNGTDYARLTGDA